MGTRCDGMQKSLSVGTILIYMAIRNLFWVATAHILLEMNSDDLQIMFKVSKAANKATSLNIWIILIKTSRLIVLDTTWSSWPFASLAYNVLFLPANHHCCKIADLWATLSRADQSDQCLPSTQDMEAVVACITGTLSPQQRGITSMPLEPTMATQNPELSSTNLLNGLDRTTQVLSWSHTWP